MNNIFHTLFYIPIEKSLLFFYNLSGNNLGIAIILLTIAIRIILIPLTIPSLKSAEKLKVLKPELDDIKKRHKQDPKKLQEEQMKLYQKHGINPASGCLPLLLQLPILLFLYRVLLDFLKLEAINTNFLIFNLIEPDKYFVLPILASISQFILSFMMSTPSPKKIEQTEKKEGDFADSLNSALQTQNLYIMPVLWFFIMFKLPAGISLYWTVSNIFSLVQQFILVGPGRLKTIFKSKENI